LHSNSTNRSKDSVVEELILVDANWERDCKVAILVMEYAVYISCVNLCKKYCRCIIEKQDSLRNLYKLVSESILELSKSIFEKSFKSRILNLEATRIKLRYAMVIGND